MKRFLFFFLPDVTEGKWANSWEFWGCVSLCLLAPVSRDASVYCTAIPTVTSLQAIALLGAYY